MAKSIYFSFSSSSLTSSLVKKAGEAKNLHTFWVCGDILVVPNKTDLAEGLWTNTATNHCMHETAAI